MGSFSFAGRGYELISTQAARRARGNTAQRVSASLGVGEADAPNVVVLTTSVAEGPSQPRVFASAAVPRESISPTQACPYWSSQARMAPRASPRPQSAAALPGGSRPRRAAGTRPRPSARIRWKAPSSTQKPVGTRRPSICESSPHVRALAANDRDLRLMDLLETQHVAAQSLTFSRRSCRLGSRRRSHAHARPLTVRKPAACRVDGKHGRDILEQSGAARRTFGWQPCRARRRDSRRRSGRNPCSR
jgi:hypothetical protein